MHLSKEKFKELTGEDPKKFKDGFKLEIQKNLRSVLADVATAAALAETRMQAVKVSHQVIKKGPITALDDYVKDKYSKNLQDTTDLVKLIYKIVVNNEERWKTAMARMDRIEEYLKAKKIKEGVEESGESEGEDEGEGEGGKGVKGYLKQFWNLFSKIVGGGDGEE